MKTEVASEPATYLAAVNALGINGTAWKRIADCCEQRGFSFRFVGREDTVEGLGLGAPPASKGLLIGWCTGARIALQLASQQAGRYQGLILLNGDFSDLYPVFRTEYQSEVEKVVGAVSRRAGVARMLVRAMRNTGAHPLHAQNLPAELNESIRAPFMDEEQIIAYAKEHRDYVEYLEGPTVDRLPPTLIVTGKRDSICDYRSSVALAAEIPDCSLLVVDSGSHYMLYEDRVVAEEIVGFCSDVRNQPRPKDQ